MKRPVLPEVIAAREQAQARFTQQAMDLVRAQLYAGVSESVLRREWPDLLMAISEPAAFLHRRGLAGTGAMYLGAIREVLAGIVKAGKVGQSRYRPMYLRKCLQDHMHHHQERYLDAAKALETKSAGSVAAAILKGLPAPAPAAGARYLTAVLMEARKLTALPSPAKPTRRAS